MAFPFLSDTQNRIWKMSAGKPPSDNQTTKVFVQGIPLDARVFLYIPAIDS